MATRTDPGCSWRTEDICGISTPTMLTQDQQSGRGAVASIYQVVKQDTELLRETLERGSSELKQLHNMRGLMRVNSEGILEVRFVENRREKWRVVCPKISRNVVIWTTHRQGHSGISRTTNRIKMTWYWPGMTANICCMIRTCEICQMAKSRDSEDSGERQRLHAGRPWQKLAVDLVGPLPKTPRRNKWILVLTDHFSCWQDALALLDATAPTVAAQLDERFFVI